MPTLNILWNTTLTGGGGGTPPPTGSGGTVAVNLTTPNLNTPGASVLVKFDFTGSTFDVTQNTDPNGFDPAVHEIEVYTTVDDDLATFDKVVHLPLSMRSRTSYLGQNFRIMFSTPGLKTMTHFFVETATGKTTTAQSQYLVASSRSEHADNQVVLWNPAGDTDFSHASEYANVAAANRISSDDLNASNAVWTAARNAPGDRVLIKMKAGATYGVVDLSVGDAAADNKNVTIETVGSGGRADISGSTASGSQNMFSLTPSLGDNGNVYDWRIRNFNAVGGYEASTDTPARDSGNDKDFLNMFSGALVMVDDFYTTGFTHHFQQTQIISHATLAPTVSRRWGMHVNDGAITNWGGQYGCLFCGVNDNLGSSVAATGVQMIQPQNALSTGNLHRATIRWNGCYNQSLKSCDVQTRDLNQPAFKAHEDPLIDGGQLNVYDTHFQGGLWGFALNRNADIGNLDRSVINSARVGRCSLAGSPNMQKFFILQGSGILIEDCLIEQPDIPFHNVALRWFVQAVLTGTVARDFPIVVRNCTFVSLRTSTNNNGGTVTEVDAGGFTDVTNQNNLVYRPNDGVPFSDLDTTTDFRQLQDVLGYRLTAGGGYEANTQGAASMKTYKPTAAIAVASGSVSPGSLGGEQKRDLAASRSVVGAWVGV